jgi:phage-related protein
MEIVAIHRDIQRFIGDLESSTGTKVARLIDLLSIDAYHLTMPYSKRIEKDLYELRAQSVQNVRIFYTFHDNKIVLLHAIFKKNQKLPKKDLEVARQRLISLQEA